MPKRPSAEQVAAAAERLRDLYLGRSVTTLIRFFIVKALGAGGGSDARVTTAGVAEFCRRAFESRRAGSKKMLTLWTYEMARHARRSPAHP